MAARRTGPAGMAVRRAVVVATEDLGPDDLLLVAASGGPDSTALLAACAGLRRPRPRVGVLAVDHRLRDGSGDVAEDVVVLGARLGCDGPAEVVAVVVQPDGDGLQAAARRARYAGLAAAAARHGAAAVLLGHTRDDQAETVLLGLARGSGARSASGMAVRDGLWRRPLLGLDRSTTVEACQESGLDVHEDPANVDRRHTRTRVRHDALPALAEALGDRVVAGLARTADLLRDDADLLDALADDLLQRALLPGDQVVVGATVLLAAPPALRRRALRAASARAGAPEVTSTHVEALEGLLRATPAAGGRGSGPLEVALPGGVVARRRRGTLVWQPAGPAPAGPAHAVAPPEEPPS